jgi:hypothetical protein
VDSTEPTNKTNQTAHTILERARLTWKIITTKTDANNNNKRKKERKTREERPATSRGCSFWCFPFSWFLWLVYGVMRMSLLVLLAVCVYFVLFCFVGSFSQFTGWISVSRQAQETHTNTRDFSAQTPPLSSPHTRPCGPPAWSLRGASHSGPSPPSPHRCSCSLLLFFSWRYYLGRFWVGPDSVIPATGAAAGGVVVVVVVVVLLLLLLLLLLPLLLLPLLLPPQSPRTARRARGQHAPPTTHDVMSLPTDCRLLHYYYYSLLPSLLLD